MVAQKTKIATRAVHDTVVLTIGSADITLDYETAFQMSQWLRLSARQAKAFAGDKSKTMHVIGILSDAEVNHAKSGNLKEL